MRERCNQRNLAVKTRSPMKRPLPFTESESHGYDSLPHCFSPVGFSSPASKVNSPDRTPRASLEVQSQTSQAMSSFIFSGDIKSSALSLSSLGSPGFLKIQSPFSVSNSLDTTPQHEIQYIKSQKNEEMELKQNRQNFISYFQKCLNSDTKIERCHYPVSGQR